MRLLRYLDRVSDALAFCSALLIVPLVLAMIYEVFMRYVLNAPTVWAFELSYMMMGAIFVFGIAYTLKVGDHLNEDFIHGSLGPKAKAALDLIGFAVSLPAVVWLSWAFWNYTLRAYASGGTSGLSSWNPVVWPFRAILFVGFTSLALQMILEMAKRAMVLAGRAPAQAER